jgi:uncharacterized cofD-like protein
MTLITEKIQQLSVTSLNTLDLLPHHDLREKIVALLLHGAPEHVPKESRRQLQELQNLLLQTDTTNTRVVVFGGGTGLSNILGGDSRLSRWPEHPFGGIKALFPHTSSVVCVTDDGGSTGELLKDLPLLALGDLRHVLLSSIQLSLLEHKYELNRGQAEKVASHLAAIFNFRSDQLQNRTVLEEQGIQQHLEPLPLMMRQQLQDLVDNLYRDDRLCCCLSRPHCFGNLLLAAAIYQELPSSLSNAELARLPTIVQSGMLKGLDNLGILLGAPARATLPCTSAPAQLRVCYANGVEIPGEHKLSTAQRGVPVAAVTVDFFAEPNVFPEILKDISKADIIILAPGSLYSSIIPIFKVPGLAQAVRANKKALKVLVSNLWVQTGETDLSIIDPQRKYHVSDMIKAYEENIPGGTEDLFHEVICISLQNIPASILQSYGVEGKVPIYLDREAISQLHHIPIECGVYSQRALMERGVLQHDPDILSYAVKGLYIIHDKVRFLDHQQSINGENAHDNRADNRQVRVLKRLPCERYTKISERLAEIEVAAIGGLYKLNPASLRQRIRDILWEHPVIPLSHLDFIKAIHCIDKSCWDRDQQWDNVFSFFDPCDDTIKIRADQINKGNKLEIALMIALGESLLGNYALKKTMRKVFVEDLELGSAYHLYLRNHEEIKCFFTKEQLHTFLRLANMYPGRNSRHYTRLVNREEGFTPPGLLMGLMYAWYIDNRFATHIEYKMSVMKIDKTDLIPEQLKMARRRERTIQFFKNIVFFPEYSR